MRMARKCQTVKFLKRRKLSAGIAFMSKKFSKILSGMHASMAGARKIKLLLSARQPSRTKSRAHSASIVMLCKKKSVMFSHFGIKRFT